MTDKQILKKAIEKAVDNGWDVDDAYDAEFNPEWEFYFNHDFAKAFWKDEETGIVQSGDNMVTRYFGGWQYHIQQMVLEKEPLKYLEKFL